MQPDIKIKLIYELTIDAIIYALSYLLLKIWDDSINEEAYDREDNISHGGN